MFHAPEPTRPHTHPAPAPLGSSTTAPSPAIDALACPRTASGSCGSSSVATADTALGRAAASNRRDAITCLLRLGADPDRRTTFGGPDHGRAATALHLAAGAGHLEVVRLLLDAGADPTIIDARHEHTAHGWAVHGGHEAVAELLHERGG